MLLSDFDFVLPDELIAQAPTPAREEARLYVLARRAGESAHATIADLPRFLPQGALLVVNDTRVIAARLHGTKPSGGRVELLTVEPRSVETLPNGAWREVWTCLGGASKPIRPGMRIVLDGERPPVAEVMDVRGADLDVAFSSDEAGGLLAALERIGEVPLPPYIRRHEGPTPDDWHRYQTVYARVPGLAAAPTAGLHLTPSLLQSMADRGIERVSLTLHVGLGTFSPLRLGPDERLESIVDLHAERYEIPVETAERIAAARAEGRPIIAVGTTTLRALESARLDDGSGQRALLRSGPGVTRLFIRPSSDDEAPARSFIADGLLTNFHLPGSTLLMLVAAFAGRPRILAAYADAVARGYRFFSYGDAMLIV